VVRDQVADEGRRLQKFGHQLNEEALREELKEMLEDMLARTREKRGERHGYVLKSSYLSFALQEPGEFLLLLIDFVGDWEM
jgi:hypothetical protein